MRAEERRSSRWNRPRIASGAIARGILLVLLVVSSCRRADTVRPAVYFVEPDGVVALDPRDGREIWRARVPLDRACDLAVSPDGQWVAVLARQLVLLSTRDPTASLSVDPPGSWHFPDCFQPYARAEIPWALMRWANDTTVLVLLRRSAAGQELRGVTAFDLSERSWRPWIQQLVLGCWLLAEPTPELQLSCERFPDPAWPPAVAGLLGIDPVNGGIQRRVPLIPPEPVRRLGVPFGSPVVGIARSDDQTVVLAESGLLLFLHGSEREAAGFVVWRTAGLAERASGKSLRLAADRRVVWAVLWRTAAQPVLVLLDLRSQSVARVVELPHAVADIDILADGTALLLLEKPGAFDLVRRDLRSGEERTLTMLSGEAICCWIGPLAAEHR
ncbi:MAG: hypothetical protein RMJ05_01240 [Thermomicrobium sp.]|nr:hypothetical protein [Thermomicrobium sp.]MDW8005320.1 hypothetical protein [Thermomicrobium sp.]